MTKTLLLPESDVENAALTPEATDEALILAAKELNASYNGHLRRSIEDFWKLGGTLSHLYQRRHLQGRWADILKQVGINITTDNHARRLHKATTVDGLAKFKNKTQALRFFGILSTPRPSVEMPIVSSPEASDDESGEYTGSPGEKQISVNYEEAGRTFRTIGERPESRTTPSNKRRAVEPAHVTAEMDYDQTPPIASQPTVQDADDSLEVLAKIAARLEYLAADRIDITTDHLAQIDRAMHSLASLRAKEVVDAA
jgi:hypothetical protein